MLLVGIGGLIGAITRFLIGAWITSRIKVVFPFGTWIINISGSFILGTFAVMHLNNQIADWLWLLLGVGFLGAYTTFSTFGYETIEMLKKQDIRMAIIYVFSSVIIAVFSCWSGTLIAKI